MMKKRMKWTNKVFTNPIRSTDVVNDKRCNMKIEHATTSESLIPVLTAALMGFLKGKYSYHQDFHYVYKGQSRKAYLLHGCGFVEIHVEIQNKEKWMIFWRDDNNYYRENDGFRDVLSNPRNVQDIAGKLADRILGWEIETEGYGPWVEIPDGTEYLKELIVDPNLKCYRSKKTEDADVFSLKGYAHIGTLVIPESLKTADYDQLSFFAGEEIRPFVSCRETEYKRIRIDRIDNHSPHLLVENGVLYSADKTKLIYCFEAKCEFDVPVSVTRICPYAFCGQHTLEKITLPDNLQEIGRNAFMDCRKLREISIPDGITEIKEYTFDNCLSLKKIVLPDGIKSLGFGAFRHCEALKSIDLPGSIESMSSFECCYSLEMIAIPRKIKDVDGFMFCRSLRRVRLCKGVKRISGYAFRYCENLKEINFPEGLQTIGDRAFMPNEKLTEVEFPSTLTEIGIEAFYQCKKLQSVRFASDVKTIGQAAFACTPPLLRIHKPKGMIISSDVFLQDKGLDKWGFWD